MVRPWTKDGDIERPSGRGGKNEGMYTVTEELIFFNAALEREALMIFAQLLSNCCMKSPFACVYDRSMIFTRSILKLNFLHEA